MKRLEKYLTLNNAVLTVAVLITLSWLWGTISAIQKNFLLEQQAENLKQQISVQTLKNQNLTYQKNYFNSAEFLDLAARQQPNVAGPGESVLILPPNTVSSQPSKQSSTVIVAKRSNFEQWLYFFFGDKLTKG